MCIRDSLTSDKDNAGLLDPFVIMKNVKDAESLAIDILTFLTGISSRDGEKFPVQMCIRDRNYTDVMNG